MQYSIPSHYFNGCGSLWSKQTLSCYYKTWNSQWSKSSVSKAQRQKYVGKQQQKNT